jgi:hypothetical protein
MLDALKTVAPAVVFVLWTFGANWLGEQSGRARATDRCVATVSALRAEHAEAQRLVMTDVLERLQSAKERGDALEIRLAEEAETRQIQEKTHAVEIKRLTRDRPCLDAPVVRLLNASPGLPAGRQSVPPPAGGSADPDAGPATDTDVAVWINGARKQYDTCRSRLDALIDFNSGEHDGR